MNPQEIVTKKDLLEFEERLQIKLTEAFSQSQEKDNIRVLEPLLTRKQLLSYFQISDNTLAELIKEGMPYVMIKERPRYDKLDVLSYLKQQTLSITKVGK